MYLPSIFDQILNWMLISKCETKKIKVNQCIGKIKRMVFPYYKKVSTKYIPKNKMAITLSKQLNHFCLWVLWPPTSTKRNGMFEMMILNSSIVLVALRQYKISWNKKEKKNIRVSVFNKKKKRFSKSYIRSWSICSHKDL